MNDLYPCNRLQKYLHWRRTCSAFVWLSLALFVCVAMLTTKPTYADAANYDPSSVPNLVTGGNTINLLALPTNYFSVNDCAGGTCNTGKIAVFGASAAVGSQSGIRTCIGTIPNGATVGNFADWVSDGGGHNGLQFDRFAGGNLKNTYCWSGSAWTYIGNGGSTTPYLNPASAPVLTNFDWVNTAGVSITNVEPAYGFSSTITNGQHFVTANAGYNPSLFTSTFITSTTSPYTVGQNITFKLTWSGATFTPYYLYFYDDIEETRPVQVVDYFPLGATGSWTFPESYAYAGTYHPMAVLGNNHCSGVSASGALTGSGCQTLTSLLNTSTITIYDPTTQANNQDALYPSTFTANPTQDIKVNITNVTFKYSLASNFCGTLSSAKLYVGYAPALQYLDTGSTLPVSYSGSTTIQFTRTDQPYSDFFYPYIKVSCSDGSYHTVYLGGSTIFNNAQGVSVYNANDVRFAMPYSWLNGGGSANFLTGSGFSFWSDKNVYDVGEPVKLQYDINPTFTASGAYLFDNINGNLLFTFTGADITSNAYHYATMTYSAAGTYQPYLLIFNQHYNSGDPTTYKKVYIGGASSPDPSHALYVTKNATPVWVNTGSYLGQFAGTGGAINSAGIFGLPNSTWAGFGSTGNSFLDGVLNIFIMPVARAALWVASTIYNLVASTPFFSFVTGIIDPPPATTYVTPQSVLGVPLPAYVAGQQFTVQYADHATWGFLTSFIEAIFGVAMMSYLIRAFL